MFEIDIVENIDDLIECGKLVYKQYYNEKYIDKNKFNLWLTHYQLYGSSIILQAKTYKLLCTVSMIFSPPSIVPASLSFPNEIEKLTKIYNIVEFTNFASISTIDVILRIFRFAFKIIKIKNINYVIIEVNPRHYRFYKNILGFEMVSKKDRHLYCDAPTILMGINIHSVKLPSKLNKLIKEKFPEDKNLEKIK